MWILTWINPATGCKVEKPCMGVEAGEVHDLAKSIYQKYRQKIDIHGYEIVKGKRTGKKFTLNGTGKQGGKPCIR